MRQQLRTALTGAMKARDPVAVAALRSALAAIDDAEAVGTGPAGPPVGSHPDVAGSAGALGAAEVPRRHVTEAEMSTLVEAEIGDRLAAAAEYRRAGRMERADRLEAEAKVLAAELERARGPRR